MFSPAPHVPGNQIDQGVFRVAGHEDDRVRSRRGANTTVVPLLSGFFYALAAYFASTVGELRVCFTGPLVQLVQSLPGFLLTIGRQDVDHNRFRRPAQPPPIWRHRHVELGDSRTTMGAFHGPLATSAGPSRERLAKATKLLYTPA